MLTGIKNIVVVGGSYVGKGTAAKLAQICPPTHRVLLIEPHTHFHHIFTFPRFALVPGHEHKAFIPYTAQFRSVPNPDIHAVVTAKVLSIQPRTLNLDREWEGSSVVSFDYLVLATGTTLTQPSAMKEEGKLASVKYLRKHQDQVKNASSILIVGGGAAGVQMATDLKECFPDKQVTVVQSRDRLMPKFHEKLHELIKGRFDELGVNLVTGARAVVPSGGFPDHHGPIRVQLTNGTSLSTDFVILATGQKPNNSLVANLDASSGGSIINLQNGMVRVRPTLQFADSKYDNLFAVGDIADTGAHKAARPGIAQADILTANIKALLDGQIPKEHFTVAPAAIHMSLGLKYNVVFRNPNPAEGQTEPTIVERQDGREDMGVDSFWQRMGVSVSNSSDYML